MTTGFRCERCGKCCQKLSKFAYLEQDDALKWQQHQGTVPSNYGRFHPTLFIDPFYTHPPRGVIVSKAALFFHPSMGKKLKECPFLRRDRGKTTYHCLLHSTGLKPRFCLEYPQEPLCLGQG
jgi:Fe-S-cluster containining protein